MLLLSTVVQSCASAGCGDRDVLVVMLTVVIVLVRVYVDQDVFSTGVLVYGYCRNDPFCQDLLPTNVPAIITAPVFLHSEHTSEL